MRPGFPIAVLLAFGVVSFDSSTEQAPATAVVQIRVPDRGLQPRAATDQRGVVHLVYYTGDAANGDLYYTTSSDGGTSFKKPLRVNSPGSAIATGTVRGAQLALGTNGRVHVAWNGSHAAQGVGTPPMLYTRLNDGGTAFEAERRVMHASYNIDGGGAIAADGAGRVYVVWHANAPGERDEGRRRVWIAESRDEGRTFERERAAVDGSTGACGCCGLGAFADRRGHVYILYRTAFEIVHRDVHLLTSSDFGEHFEATMIDRWNVGACVMSTQSFAPSPRGVWAAWETRGQVYLGRIDPATGALARVAEAPGGNRARKHPVMAVNSRGEVLLAWTEDTAWNKGGAAAWQVFDGAGQPRGSLARADGVPVWSLVAAYTRPDGRFGIVY